MEPFELLELALGTIVSIAKFCLEVISVFCVIAGVIKTAQLAFELSRRRDTPFPFNQIRLRFGAWLALALEFQLGADILATTVAPTVEELGKLALIAVIRTFLNFFLGKELQTEMELQKEKIEAAKEGKLFEE
ncbi:MAG: DUF1622 domain-containing protein [Aphanocapsa lilacina HA4352-LM1]|jgi:uncharacterized membrane protein|nr:DUF1622 domain-containing protein [Aphanocapsa lilacina HA4352-LM1]